MTTLGDAFSRVPHLDSLPPIKHRKKILIAITGATVQLPSHRSGFHWGEAVQPFDVFTQAGWDVDLTSENGSAIVDEASIGKMAQVGEVPRWEDKQYPVHAKLATMKPAGQIDPTQYDAIYVAGGHACIVDLPNAKNLKKLIANIYERGGVVGVACHGPAILHNLLLSSGQPLLKGKKATGFPVKGEESMGVLDFMKQHGFMTMQQVVELNGGIWEEHPSNPMAEYVVTSERLVTGMNPASAKGIANTMLSMLPDKGDEGFEMRRTEASMQQAKPAAVDASMAKHPAAAAAATDKSMQYPTTATRNV